MAVGYCTLYGDMCGGLAVISDVPKTTVYRLPVHQPARRPRMIPAGSDHQAASAELGRIRPIRIRCRPTRFSMRSCTDMWRKKKAPPQIIADGFDPATVMRVIKLIDRSEYKRRQPRRA